MMQVPFPVLTDIHTTCDDETAPVDPGLASFIGGSTTSRLLVLNLERFPFPALPLLVSATHLVDIPTSRNSAFLVHFTCGDGHRALRVDGPRQPLL